MSLSKQCFDPCIPYVNVFTTQDQTIPSNGAVSFDGLGEICGFEICSPTTVIATEGGIYHFYYYALPLLGPTSTPGSSAFALRVNHRILAQTRFGTAFASLPAQTAGPFVFWGIIPLPPGAKVNLVNIDVDPAILQNDLIPVNTSTASLTLRRISG